MAPKKYDLAAVREREGKKADPIEITAGSSTFTIDPPVLWSDATLDAVQNERLIDAAKSLLGDRYDEWTDAGGTAVLLFTIVNEATGLTGPESSASTG